MSRPRSILREPLVHFLIGGALLFALDAWSGRDDDDPSYQVTVGAGQIERLRQAWQAQSGRPPNEQELGALVEDQVREEIFYREAVRRGLDDGDVLVRRRLAQKLSFLIEDLAAVEQPSDDELRRFHQERADRYAEPARLSFRHVFFSRDRRADAAADAGAALASLRLAAASAGRPGSLGDPFMLHSEYAGRSRQEVRELFGPDFAEALFALQGSGWQGPVRSSYGEHLVEVSARADQRTPPFEEVRQSVLRDFQQERREQANAEAYREMRSRYQVEVEEPQPDREARREGAR
jgi:parvulin-like peptidyl-prolyl isomerase